jgi:xanthine dehydrogenase molybdopterin-binding subunit B
LSLSTHVLDTARREPAVGVPVRLEEHDGAGWVPVVSAQTDRDGRLRGWLPDDLRTARHRLVFDTGTYLGVRLPEVYAVRTAEDVPGPGHCGLEIRDQPVLALGQVRYQGEPVAIVVAIRAATGRPLTRVPVRIERGEADGRSCDRQ